MKILLVDDDVSIIQALLPALKSVRGYQTRAAISGDKAIENAEAWDGIDLLVTDIFMSPMNGFTLRNKLRKHYPEMRTLFITGYDVSTYSEYLEGCEVLVKPVDPHKLVRAITEMNIQASTTPSAPRALGSTGSVAVPKSVSIPQTGAVAGTKPFLPKAKVVTASVPLKQPEPQPVPAAAPEPVAEPVPEEVPVARMIGEYRILRELGTNRWGTIYQALQVSMNREVVMEILSDDLANDPAVKQQFIANASAKANVQHPFVLAVYEAGDVEGNCFYTYEYIEGENLASLIAAGNSIDEQAAQRILKGVAEAMAYFHRNNIPHGELETASIYLGQDNKPRLANLAIQEGGMPDVPGQIQTLANIIGQAIHGGKASGKSLRTMLACMQAEGDRAFQSWEALIQLSQALQPKAIPADAYQLRAQEEATRQALVEAAKRQKRQILWSTLSLLLLAALTIGVVYWKFFSSQEKSFDRMVKVPAGEFIYQSGQKLNLPDFWIDEHEVSLGQYEKFLDYLKQHPDEATKWDHRDQPKGKSHIPRDWEIVYPRAKARKPVKFLPIDLNCPIYNVDWWDAYAYANWKGRRLPTEQEWEKAGRGTDGRLYPWGNDWDPKKCNSSADYVDKPGPNTPPGKVDGYFAWSPVDAITTDVSPCGAVGMAGNVSEWTGSWNDAKKFPVIRGGNYHTPDNTLTRRIAVLDPEGVSEYLGFRTASDHPPTAK
ncbi:MAG: SUMF1/EgtB/PvdO family nonheme iron enzyme [Verrucomicrobiota bacterium]